MTCRFGAVVDGAAGADVVVTGSVVTGTVDVDVGVSGVALDVVTSVTCTVVGVAASDVSLDEQAARTPRPKEATKIGVRMRVFMPLACRRALLTHAQSWFWRMNISQEASEER